MNNLLPAQALKMLEGEHKKSNQEVIIDYLLSENSGDIQLTDLQKNLLERWMKADELLCSGKYNSRECANILTKYFDYGIATAWRDIEDARFVFGNTKKPSKAYRLNAHLDRIDELIIFWGRRDGKLVQKLLDSYTYALSLLKDEGKDQPLPTAIIFNYNLQTASDLLDKNFTPDEAREVAAEKLKERGVSDEYLDFEPA